MDVQQLNALLYCILDLKEDSFPFAYLFHSYPVRYDYNALILNYVALLLFR